jgi:hypothetical protein
VGCDIHMFIEYSDFTDQNGEPYWSCFAGRYNPGRDYKMFGLLANVRCDGALFPPRDLPAGEHSYQVDDYMRIWIGDEKDASERTCTLEQAQKWSAQGETIIPKNDGTPGWVTDPDLHSHSWLTLDEYRQVLNRYRLGDAADMLGDHKFAPEDRVVAEQAVVALSNGGGEQCDVGYGAILAVMEHFAANGCQTRLIFCFDN